MRLARFIYEGTAALTGLYPPEEARAILLLVTEELLGTKSYTHIIEPDYEIPPFREGILTGALERLRQGEPVQYVLGKAEFCGRVFHVAPGVLIPRPETEQLVGQVIDRCAGRPLRVLDLCTGSGCIAWSVALSVPGCTVVGVDISEQALRIARSQPFEAPPGLCFERADVLEDLVEEPFDIVVSNPPYIMESEKPFLRRNVLDYEPPEALFVPDDDPLVFYRAVARWASRCLVPGGWGIVEINETLGEETASVFRAAGFVKVLKNSDFLQKNRFVSFEKRAL